MKSRDNDRNKQTQEIDTGLASNRENNKEREKLFPAVCHEKESMSSHNFVPPEDDHDASYFFSNVGCRYHPRVGLSPRDRTPLIGCADPDSARIIYSGQDDR